MPSDFPRRTWLLATAGLATTAGLTTAGARVTWAAGPLPARRKVPALNSVPSALNELESLLAPEAMADILARPEPELINYQVGIDRAVNDLWGGWKLAVPLARTLRAQAVSNDDSLSGYFLTTLARLRRGVALNTDEQLDPFRQASRRESEAAERLREGYLKSGLRVDLVPMDVRDRVAFTRNSAAIGLDQERPLKAVADTVRANPFIQILQVQAHAGAAEHAPRPLSQQRARAVMDKLVTLGAPRERLAALGFGADYPNDDRAWRDRPDRDRQVDFLILRRERKAI